MDVLPYRTAAVRTASYLCRHGIQVFPAQFATKGGGVMWKDIATNDINMFVRSVPPGLFNLAMVFGPDSGVMDVEPDDEASSLLIEGLMAENGVKTLAYRSKRGIHRIFRWEHQFSHWNNANPKAGKLDIRMGTASKGAYSICPPSVHPETGEHYMWLPGCAPWEIAPAPLPENVLRYILSNVKTGPTKGRVLEVEATDDGYLPGVGGRHDYLLGFSKLLYCNLLLPKEDCVEHVRLMSQRLGTYDEPKRGEAEVQNCFNGLKRPIDPVKEMSAHISMSVVNEVVEDTFTRHTEANRDDRDEIPSHIFHPKIQAASLAARACQHPRNLWLMTCLTASAAARGTSVLVRASEYSPVTGCQLYSFGVGGSGSGKSKCLKALLAPFTGSDTVITDATPEALTSNLAKFPRGIMLELSEGKDFYKMLGRYNQNPGAGSDNSLFHKCWSGDRMRIQRQKGALWIESPFLTVSAAIQRLNLNQLPQNDSVDGLLQRMLLYPIGMIPKRSSPEALRDHKLFIDEWFEILGRQINAKATVGSRDLASLISGAGVVVQPTTYTLDSEAQKLWDDYAAMKRSDSVEAQWPDPEHPFRSDIVRHAEYVLRIAATLMDQDMACDANLWYEWKVAEQNHGWIPKSVMQRAIDLMEWLWWHKQILTENLVETAYAAVSNESGLKRSEGVPTKVEGYIESRKRRMETRIGEEWTLRDYYQVLRLKKIEAQRELDLFMREGRVEMHDLKENQKAIRYSFTEGRD